MSQDRNRKIKSLLLELKAHLKTTKGEPREDAVAYFKPAPVRRKKKTRAK